MNEFIYAVHGRQKMRKKDETLREKLLSLAREAAEAEGLESIAIRDIAKKAGVASGTVYNYFASKDEILLALTEEYWKQTLLEMTQKITSGSFCEQLQEFFHFLRAKMGHSAEKMMRSLVGVGEDGLERMAAMQESLQAVLVQRMEQDTDIRGDVWTETFTKQRVSGFIMANIMVLLVAKEPDLNLFIEVIKRTIY